MKGTTIFFLSILLITTGCKRLDQTADDLITVDVTNDSFPKKELALQDFMDVEYIPLETNDDFVNQGFVQAIGKEFILVKNYRDDGDIFVYDRTGKAIRKINRKGQGGEEYISCRSVTLDEENNEMFINDFLARKIKVYDLEGNFKRSIKQKQDGDMPKSIEGVSSRSDSMLPRIGRSISKPCILSGIEKITAVSHSFIFISSSSM